MWWLINVDFEIENTKISFLKGKMRQNKSLIRFHFKLHYFIIALLYAIFLYPRTIKLGLSENVFCTETCVYDMMILMVDCAVKTSYLFCLVLTFPES